MLSGGHRLPCTNRREDFDAAAMRRFHWKLTFSPPRPEQLRELYRAYFSPLCGEPDEATLSTVAALRGLCPGDFSATYQALRPWPGTGRAISHGEVLERLRSERGYREPSSSGTIGFGR